MKSFKIALAAGCVGLVFLGAGALVEGQRERSLARRSSEKPEEITLRALVERGPDGNPNVLLKDFVFGDDYVHKGNQFSSHTAWLPVFPTDEVAGQANPSAVPALVKFKARSIIDVARLKTKMKLRGMVINRVEPLGDEEKALLRERYPATDFSRCLIVEEGREPPRPGTFRSWFVVGWSMWGTAGLSLLVLAGLALFGVRRRPGRRAPAWAGEALLVVPLSDSAAREGPASCRPAPGDRLARQLDNR